MTSPGIIRWKVAMEEPMPKRFCARSTATGSQTGDADRPSLHRTRGRRITACGCWIYSGSYAGGVNQTARRKPHHEQSWVAPEWAWAWPANRRLLYNRASADPEGRPWSERKKYVWWDQEKNQWTGHDVAGFHLDRPPSYRPAEGAHGIASISGIDPFILKSDGKAWIFAPKGWKMARCPRHYEPQESVIRNPLYGQQCNPAAHGMGSSGEPVSQGLGRSRLPVRPHHLPSHRTPYGRWYVRAGSPGFPNCSPKCSAKSRLSWPPNSGLHNGGWATIATARAEIEARVLVTARLQPLRIQGRVMHQIGLPYHWGDQGHWCAGIRRIS